MANIGKKDGDTPNPQAQGSQKPGEAKPSQAVAPQQQGQPQRGQLARRDPFELMRDPFGALVRDPFQLLRDLMVDPLRLLRQAPWMGREVAAWNPEFEVRETDDAFVIRADMPGMRSDDLEINLVGDQLRISGSREQEQEQGEGRYHTYERSYGSFTRVFTLPDTADVDKIRSDLATGVLTLVIPKKQGAQPQRRKIQIGTGSKS
ncbi:MAG: Hsp20/alpha crystallin family protein [Deltaproteobacteria bacterium]|nr:Hsp20/alpha crystallin family protein [Deltaproteobacteria bacterium]